MREEEEEWLREGERRNRAKLEGKCVCGGGEGERREERKREGRENEFP